MYTSVASGISPSGPPVSKLPKTLDPNLEQFLQKGFLVLPPAGSAELHSTIYARAWAIHAKGPEETWKLADGVLSAIPELQQVVEAPGVRQGLTSILGEGYMLHGHRHLHVSTGNNQMWHKDSYWGFRKVRKHRPRWLMMLYYPQDTNIAMGPTCIMAGSQYWTKNTEHTECGEDILLPNSGEQSMFLPPGGPQHQSAVLKEAKTNYLLQNTGLAEDLELTVPAGTCVLMHYDLFHRASARSPGSTAPERFLVKFQFLRTTEPCPDAQVVLPSRLSGPVPHPHLQPILADLRAWYCGAQCEHASSLLSERAKDAELLTCGAEVERVAAAYRLGRAGARQLLARALQAEDEGTARAAAYGLSAAGPAAATSVLPLLKSFSNRVRRYAAFVVGEAARPDAAIVAGLGDALSEDFSSEAKCELLEALGIVAARARSLGQDEICKLCMHHVLPFLEQSGATWAKTQTGECAAYAMLLAAGLKGQAPPHVLTKLADVADAAKGDHLMATFAAEVLRRSSMHPQIQKQRILPGLQIKPECPPAKRLAYTAQACPPMRTAVIAPAPWLAADQKTAYVMRRSSPTIASGHDMKVEWPDVPREHEHPWSARTESTYVSTP